MDIVIAFILQQWLHERASVLRYQYIACLAILAKSIRFVLGSLNVQAVVLAC